jgi:predicted permease
MSLTRDLRYTLRTLRKAPAFTAAAVLTLGLGVGANATVFTWLKAVLLDPLPGVAEGARLVTLNQANRQMGMGGYSTRYRHFLYYRRHASVFSAMIGFELAPVNLARDGRPEVALAGLVSEGYFQTLGVRPALGRAFSADETRAAGGQPVVVLGDRLWRRRFAADPHIVGRTVRLDGQPFTVVGVAPAAFQGSYGGIAQDLWVPITMQPRIAPGGDLITSGKFPVQIIGRLRPGVTRAQAQAELDLLGRALWRVEPSRTGWREIAKPLAESERGVTSGLAGVVKILMAMVSVVLLIGCMNVANLLLARALGRQREVATRLALGASRWRLVAQLLTESLLLTALGGVAALLIAALAGRTLPNLLPPLGMPLGLNLALDWRVLGFTAATAAATALLFGLVPALLATRVPSAQLLKDAGAATTGTRRHARLRSGLVVAQLALSMAALVAAGLAGRSLAHRLGQNPGFATGNLLLTSFDVFLGGYDKPRGARFYEQLQERVAALPGVRSAALADYVPLGFSRGGNVLPLAVPGYVPRPGEDLDVVYDVVTPGYLRTLGIGLAAGRDFAAGDRDGGAPVVLVNQDMARRYLAGGPALGRHIQVGGIDREVVGVFRDFDYRSLGEAASPLVLVPFAQRPDTWMTLVVRTAGDPYAALPAVRAAAAALDPGLPQFETMSFEQRLSASLFENRLAVQLLAAFGLLAVALAAVGLFGVIAYFVGRREREIGIRMALGAERRRIELMVLGEGLRLAAGGLGIGLLVSAACARLLGGLLHGVSPLDPAVFAGVTAGLVLVALAACYLPARRAAGLEPQEALRQS